MQFLLLRHLSQQLIVVRFRRTTSERKSIILGDIIFPSLQPVDEQRNPVSRLFEFFTRKLRNILQQHNYCVYAT